MTGFGKQLVESVHEPWAEHYVRYKILKKIIKLIAAAESSPVSVDTARAKLAGLAPAELPLLERQVQEGALSRIALEQFWEEILEVEHGRVKSFSLTTREKLEDQANEPRPSPGNLVPEGGGDAEPLAHLSKSVEPSLRRRVALHREGLEERRLLLSFQDVNYLAFFKIVKKFDKVTGRGLLPLIMQRLDAEMANGWGARGGGGDAAAADSEALAKLAEKHKSKSIRLIKDAGNLSRRAIVTQAPLLSSPEKKKIDEKVDIVEGKRPLNIAVSLLPAGMRCSHRWCCCAVLSRGRAGAADGDR